MHSRAWPTSPKGGGWACDQSESHPHPEQPFISANNDDQILRSLSQSQSRSFLQEEAGTFLIISLRSVFCFSNDAIVISDFLFSTHNHPPAFEVVLVLVILLYLTVGFSCSIFVYSSFFSFSFLFQSYPCLCPETFTCNRFPIRLVPSVSIPAQTLVQEARLTGISRPVLGAVPIPP